METLAPPLEAHLAPGLRARKKLETRRLLRRCALELVAERGFNQVTVDEIAEAANVSPRTFFNYFPSKEAALFGAHGDRATTLVTRLVERPADEDAPSALRAVLVDEARSFTDELDQLGADPAVVRRILQAVHADPALRSANAAYMATVECLLTEALAGRLGLDPGTDPYPGVLASATMGGLRAVVRFWSSSGGDVPLEQLVEDACRAVASGLSVASSVGFSNNPKERRGANAKQTARSGAVR